MNPLTTAEAENIIDNVLTAISRAAKAEFEKLAEAMEKDAEGSHQG